MNDLIFTSDPAPGPPLLEPGSIFITSVLKSVSLHTAILLSFVGFQNVTPLSFTNLHSTFANARTDTDALANNISPG